MRLDIKDKIKHIAYPVEKLGGLLFGLSRTGAEAVITPLGRVGMGKRQTMDRGARDLHCNWLQPMENSVDPSHLYWLHGDTAHLVGAVDHYEEEHEFIPFEYGIMKVRRHSRKKTQRRSHHRPASAVISEHFAPCVPL